MTADDTAKLRKELVARLLAEASPGCECEECLIAVELQELANVVKENIAAMEALSADYGKLLAESNTYERERDVARDECDTLKSYNAQLKAEAK